MKARDFIIESLKDPNVKAEYDKLEPEFILIRQMIESRYELDMSQQDLANITGIDRSDISKLENGCANPTLSTLKKIAKAFDKKLVIKFK